MPYRRIRTARYRVWCLEELRRHFSELTEPASGIDPKREAPFAPGHSMTGLGGR